MLKLENAIRCVEIEKPTQCPYNDNNICLHPHILKKHPWLLKCEAMYRVHQHMRDTKYPLFPEDCPLDDNALASKDEYCNYYYPHHGECDDSTSDNCHLFLFFEEWYGAYRIKGASE